MKERPFIPEGVIADAQKDCDACGHGVIVFHEDEWVRLDPNKTVVLCNAYKTGLEEGKKYVFGG